MSETEMDANRYPCGHPRTPENTRTIASEGARRCRECRRRYMRNSINRVRHEGVRIHLSRNGQAACGAQSLRLALAVAVDAVTCGHCKHTLQFRVALQPMSGAEVER